MLRVILRISIVITDKFSLMFKKIYILFVDIDIK